MPEPADTGPDPLDGNLEPVESARGAEIDTPRQGEVRRLPVPAEAAALERKRLQPLPAAIVAATGGFLAGVGTFILVRLLRRPGGTRPSLRRRGRRDRALDVAATRSFLVDIHLLKR